MATPLPTLADVEREHMQAFTITNEDFAEALKAQGIELVTLNTDLSAPSVQTATDSNIKFSSVLIGTNVRHHDFPR